METLVENIVNALNKSYIQLEDKLNEHDITKQEFIDAEKLMRTIAQSIGINEHYPFKSE